MRPYYKIALLAALLVVLSAISSAVYLFYKEAADTGSMKPDFTVSATDLQKEFEQNETAATAKYTNSILEVKGTVSSLTKTEGGNVNITLKTGSDLSSVICTFPESRVPSQIKVGDEISVKGVCSGFLMDVLLNNCSMGGL